MNRINFSEGFDTLVGSFSRTANFGEDVSKADLRFDEFEKSQFLTKAQEEYALSLYTGKNPYGESFEQTEELRRYLAALVKEDQLTPISTSNGKPLGVDSKSKFFTLPADLWFITYESVKLGEGKCDGHTSQDVYPVTQDEYHKIKKNPFRGANYRRALRLDLSDNIVEIVSKYEVTEYYLRYLRKLRPIILVDLTPDDQTIEGFSIPSECELPDVLHQRILELAVRMALQSKGYTTNNENK